jgi:4-alpha-glucanotransferase
MKRSSGVLMQVSSLWREYSEGSLGEEALKWIDFLSDCGFSYWQVLPFCMVDEYNSPYKSYSSFSGNLYFVDLESLHDEGLITEEELSHSRQSSPYLCSVQLTL